MFLPGLLGRRHMGFAWLLPLALLAAACSGPAEPENDDDTAAGAIESAAPNALDAALLIRGLLDSPASPARAASASHLRASVDVMVAAQFSRERRTDEGKITSKVLDFTVTSLTQTERCAPEERLRVYRGTGRQYVIRERESQRKGGLHLYKGIATALKQAWGGYVSNEEAFRRVNDVSTKIPMPIVTDKAAAKRMNDLVEAVPYGSIGTAAGQTLRSALDGATALGLGYSFGFDRFRKDSQTEEQTRIGFSFQEIALDHSQGAPWEPVEGSPFSPLISVTFDKNLPASRNWGPGFIVADICPERVMMLQYPEYPEEQEAYVPLFILPEEIVHIVSHPGSDAAAIQAATDDFTKFEENAPPSAMTSAFRACLTADGATWASAREAFYSTLADPVKGATIATFRKNIGPALKTACPAH